MTTPSDIFRNSVYSVLNNVNTALPAIIVSSDPITNKASVQPALNKAYLSGAEPMPILESVPIMFPNNITFPVNTGDYVLLIFCQRSLDLWLSKGGQVTPDDPRKFDLSDAIAITGLRPFTDDFSGNNGKDFKISFGGSEIVIKENGDIIIKTTNKVAIGNTTNELLKIISDLLQFLSTSVTENPSQPIEGANADPNFPFFYSNLKAQIEAIRADIT